MRPEPLRLVIRLRRAGSSWGSVEPLLAIVGEEVEAKLDVQVSFDLSALWAQDLAGRASSFKAMVVAGMALDKAAALSGLMGAEPEG